ncbi:hypothetical protein CAAN1_07S04016 [[Candida] anglica]|uniref:Zn(2)-C6 fungal-type domain-containing protein n=1 Tax=[Candida] anglica TaxID=148631 RepID=A0ABP0EBA0_9ASCO
MSSQKPKKNSRVKQACDFCRSRKAKCDGKEPVCSACVSNPGGCTYTNSHKRRGLPSGYTHDLERKVLVFQAVFADILCDGNEIAKFLKGKLENCLLPNSKDNIITRFGMLQTKWDQTESSKLVDMFVIQNSSVIQTAKKSTKGLTPHEALEGYKSSLEAITPPKHVEHPQRPLKQENTTHVDIPTNGGANIPMNNSMIPMSNSQLVTNTPGTLSSTTNVAPGTSTNKSTGIVSTSGNVSATSQAFNSLLSNPLFNVSNGSLVQDYNLLNDPSFFLKDDIFQFITDELDTAKDNWEPIALQYHGVSSLISGFTSRSIQQYNNTLTFSSKKPFRVGSIFNISSSAITAAIENTIKLPLEIFEFPEDIKTLVDRYFVIYHPWFPMLNRLSIMRQVQHLQSLRMNSSSSPTFQASDCNLIALVWAIMALGKMGSSPQDTSSTVCASFAKNCIKALENSPTSTIETIQTMVILGLFYYQSGDWDYSWVLISSGTRMAIDVRLMSRAVSDEQLNNPTSSQKFDSASLNNINRERTWSCIYMLNTLLSSRMGRSPLVRAMDWPIPKVSEDGWEEWEAWNSYHSPNVLKLDCGRCLSTFNQLIKVVSIWNLALTSTIDMSEHTLVDDQDETEIYKIPRPESKARKLGHNTHTLAYFQKRLSDWLKDLPDYCLLEHYSDMSKVPPFVAFLHLAYATTWCILAVRLSELRKSLSNSVKEQVIEIRDQQYSMAILLIKRIITKASFNNLKDYPFMDYFLILGFSFPKMMKFEGVDTTTHIRDFKKLLTHGSTLTVPCMIALNVYNIMIDDDSGVVTSTSNKKRRLEIDFKESELKNQKLSRTYKRTNPQSTAGFSQSSSISSPMSITYGGSANSSSVNTPFNLLSKGGSPMHTFEYRRNLDTFMIDLNPKCLPRRQQQFQQNLGYLFSNEVKIENQDSFDIPQSHMGGGEILAQNLVIPSRMQPIPQVFPKNNAYVTKAMTGQHNQFQHQ